MKKMIFLFLALGLFIGCDEEQSQTKQAAKTPTNSGLEDGTTTYDPSENPVEVPNVNTADAGNGNELPGDGDDSAGDGSDGGGDGGDDSNGDQSKTEMDGGSSDPTAILKTKYYTLDLAIPDDCEFSVQDKKAEDACPLLIDETANDCAIEYRKQIYDLGCGENPIPLDEALKQVIGM